MKICYRPHRNTLKNALKEQRIFYTFNDMLDYITANREAYNFVSKEDIYLKYYCYDSRISEETFAVLVSKYGPHDYMKDYGCPQMFGFVSFKASKKDEEINVIIDSLKKQLKKYKRVLDVEL